MSNEHRRRPGRGARGTSIITPSGARRGQCQSSNVFFKTPVEQWWGRGCPGSMAEVPLHICKSRLCHTYVIHANACAAAAIVQRHTMANRRNQKYRLPLKSERPRTLPETVISRYYSLSPPRCKSKMHSRILEQSSGEA